MGQVPELVGRRANSAGYWGSTTTIDVTGTDDVHPSDTGHAAVWATIRPLLVPAA
ncbi:hypothetical protein ACTWLI_12470 [Arthrobacter sp. Hor0625]|uniref:hypothetical protein n=1 Tax=Arthrobacter sp. Hor0625 TaxID=3457358 RepID=UPI00403EECAF